MRKYLIFTSTVALVAFWIGVVLSNNKILPFAVEEIMTVSFLAVIFMGYIFIEIEFTPDYSTSKGTSNTGNQKKTNRNSKKPVFAQQLLENRKFNLQPKKNTLIQYAKKVTGVFEALSGVYKNRKNKSTDVAEKKINDMFALCNLSQATFKLDSEEEIKAPITNVSNYSNDQIADRL